jgi:hypothetical protein
LAESEMIYIPFLNESKKLPFRVPTDIGVWSWWIIFSIILLFSVIGLISAINLEGFKSGLLCLGIILMLGFGFLKLHPNLLITTDGVCYREFFFWQRVGWSDIQEIQTIASITPKYKLKGGMIEMDIYQNGTQSPNPIAINLKVFTSDGLIIMAEMIAMKAPQAKLDETTENLRKGIMPSLFS